MKLKIAIQNGSLAGKTAELENGFLTIGRDLNCQVRFDPNERVISSKHAYIEARHDGFYITDNGSTNGTFVNGNRVQTQKLNSGDNLSFGKEGVAARIYIEIPPPVFQQNHFSPPPVSPPTNFGAAEMPPSAVATPVLPNQSQKWSESMTRIGLRPPDAKISAAAETNRKVAIGGTIFGVVFMALIVVSMITNNLGADSALLAAFIAFVPACVYILPLVWLDRYDPEPLWLLGLAFAWGAIIAILISAPANDIMGELFGKTVQAVVSAPVFEEGSKGLGLVILLLFFRREFDDILDGIVYGGTIALGFATVENVLYYGRAYNSEGIDLLIPLFVVRGIMSPFAHVTFTAMTGIGCGIARESHDKRVRILMPILGYGCAVILHAIWNGVPEFLGPENFLRFYTFFHVPFFLIFVSFAGYIMYRQNKILKEMLAIDVARGLITEEQFQKVTSAFRSTAWLLSGIGTEKFKVRQNFLRAVGKLGLTYWHIRRAQSAQGHTASFQQNPLLREEVLKWRDKT